MTEVLLYIKDFWKETNKIALSIITIFTAILVFINYYFGIEPLIVKNNPFLIKLLCWYAVFLLAFLSSYFIIGCFSSLRFRGNPLFIFLLMVAPFLFAVKMCAHIDVGFSDDAVTNRYWNTIIYWPSLLLFMLVALYMVWRVAGAERPFYGCTRKSFNWKPYALMLAIMIPVIAIAATQPGFQAVYPKMRWITDPVKTSLFELSYGSDFFTIELFFRGFLVLGFIRWAGKDAILPMACFYCTIHFGKPLGECISSYFGGMLLGIVVYNTRSIFGGLLVHLGIAWMMEMAGYLMLR